MPPPTSVDIIPIEKAAQPDEKLSSFAIIKRMLKRFNLKLGADIRYLPLENEYYIYPQEK